MVKEEELEIVMNQEWLIYSIMKRYRLYPNQEDLYQVGMIALVKAYRSFDPAFGVKFSTYAFQFVLGEISKYVKNDRSIRVSHDVLKLNQVIEHTRELLSQRLMREPSLEEISQVLELPVEKIMQTKEASEYVKSLDYCLNEDDDQKEMLLYHSIGQEEKAYDPEIIDLKEALRKLPVEEQQLIYARYYQQLTQTETSELLGISQVQVFRKEQKIYQKLRQDLAA